MSVKTRSSSDTSTLEDPVLENKKSTPKPVIYEEEQSFIEQSLPAQGLQERIKNIPIVDAQKVEEIKQKLNNLELNPQRIAEKILLLENELFEGELSARGPVKSSK